jgi:hypothetical protein
MTKRPPNQNFTPVTVRIKVGRRTWAEIKVFVRAVLRAAIFTAFHRQAAHSKAVPHYRNSEGENR